jgi:hypothetical protein
MNLQNWTIIPDIGNDKPDLKISNKVPQEQAEVLSQKPSSEWLDSSIVKAVQAFTVCRIRGKYKVYRYEWYTTTTRIVS